MYTNKQVYTNSKLMDKFRGGPDDRKYFGYSKDNVKNGIDK